MRQARQEPHYEREPTSPSSPFVESTSESSISGESKDAAKLVRLVKDEIALALGISDCYASSYLTAVPASPHGYDVADPTTINPEIGTEAEYWNWIDALAARHMGHVLDLVPNHMGIAKSANPWWQDVLENGPSSRFAHFFDIEWNPVKDELADKLGAFVRRCYDNVLPIAPDTFFTILSVHLDT